MGPLKMNLLCIFLFLAGCASNPNKPEETSTVLDKAQPVSSDTQLGLNEKGEVVTSRKVTLAQQLIGLQKAVYELEYEIYGNKDLGRKGLYGILRRCLDEGNELKRLPPRTILTAGEDDIRGKMLLDEEEKLVNVKEEFFLERIKRFEGYKDSYERQQEDFDERIRICEHDLKKKKSTAGDSVD